MCRLKLEILTQITHASLFPWYTCCTTASIALTGVVQTVGWTWLLTAHTVVTISTPTRTVCSSSKLLAMLSRTMSHTLLVTQLTIVASWTTHACFTSVTAILACTFAFLVTICSIVTIHTSCGTFSCASFTCVSSACGTA